MFKKFYRKKVYFFLTFILCFTIANSIYTRKQAQAFYLEVPDKMQNALNSLKNKGKVLGETATNSDGATVSVPTNNYATQPAEVKPTETCNVNGTEMQGPCSNYSSMPNPQTDNNEQWQKEDMERQAQDEQRQKENEDRKKKDEGRWLNDVQRGNKEMEKNLNRLNGMFIKAEKGGTEIPSEIKEKLARAKKIIESVKTITIEELQDFDMQELGDLMRELDEAREELIDKAQRLNDIKRELKNISKELAKFEKQVEKLKKQKFAVPDDLAEVLKNIKTTVDAIQKAKTWEEAETAGIEDVRDLWDALNENRQKLEMLSRWPQTLKEIDRELKKLDQELKRAKKTADSAKKKGIDIFELYNNFENAVNNLKNAKGVALKKMADGDSEGAFEVIENDLFDQMEDTWEYQRLLFTISDLGKIKSEIKKRLNEFHRMMTQLKKKKIDVSEIEKLIVYATIKGKEIETLLKAKPVDIDKVMDMLGALEDLKQEFDETANELLGTEDLMPWEEGKNQFETPKLPDNWNKLVPQKCEEQNCAEEKMQETKKDASVS
ncbi:MAG: hypothetical protein V1891_04035 [bacterium]